MQTRASLAAWYALAILSVALLYSVVDGQVLILLAQPLKADLHLSDTQIGSLQGIGSVLFATIAVVPLGWLADRIDRRLLLALCILVWSAAIAACGLASSYWTLLVCVAFLGAGEAGLSPIVYSLIPELFPERQRVTANFIFYTATFLGAGVGIAIAGAVVQNIGLVGHLVPGGLFARETWRLVFFVVAIPGPFLALAMMLIRLERRAAAAPARSAPAATQDRSKLLGYLATDWQAIAAVFVPLGLARLGAAAIFTWMPIILMREAGVSAGRVGAGMGAAITIGSVAGLLGAGAAAKFLTPRWGALTPVRLSQLSYLVHGLLSPLYFLARTPEQTFAIATLQMAAGIGGGALMPTLVQDLAPGDLRGRVFAISAVTATVFQIVSPIAVGLLSDHVFAHAGGLLKAAVAVALPSLLLSALILKMAEGHILGTAEKVRALAQAA